ncbi:ATP-dependent RNA helicase DHX30-like [Glandiceps talaboti]
MAAPMVRNVLCRFGRPCMLCNVRQNSEFIILARSASSFTGRKDGVRSGRWKQKKRPQKSSSYEPLELTAEHKQAIEEFPSPKSLLNNAFILIPDKTKRKLTYRTFQSAHMKTCHLTIKYPEEFQVVGIGRRKAEAEKMAAAMACAKLKEYGVLDERHRPVMPEYGVYSQNQIREFLYKQSLPRWIRINPELQENISDYLGRWKAHEAVDTSDTISPHFEGIETISDFETTKTDVNNLEEQTICDETDNVFSGKPYQELSGQQLLWKNTILRDQMDELVKNQSPSLLKIRDTVQSLPITAMRSEIFSLIENNQVIVLEGDTGCGKTTQVPQIIFDEYIKNNRGAECNIVVTQPRRISAISIAERVAEERGETVGQTIGYQVRLQNKRPMSGGCVLFCTVGILLTKMHGNQSLKGVSHVIIDEVHERDVNADFLMILVKDILQQNKDIKIILMSASINAKMFSQYFNNCPIISVPGMMYPVKEYFLPDISKMIGSHSISRSRQNGHRNGRHDDNRPDTDWDKVADTINFIDSTKPSGAILCFLPGWQDIVSVRNRLQELWSDDENHWVFPVHSSVPMSKQQAIFERPPEGVRKVVLATNIAETSITINDVVYVVNPGTHKEISYNVDTGTSCLDLQWVSRASVRQRRGRAGRCQPGECYHLFTRDQYKQMEEYHIAEMLRVPLEQLVVQTKVHSPETLAEDFLGKALEAPSSEAVEKAVEVLQDLDVLDEKENLTALGQKISHLSLDPRLGKAIIYSVIFRCLDPVLTITSSLSSKNVFTDSLEKRSEIAEIKQKFAGESRSDHIAQLNSINQWLYYDQYSRRDGFCFAMDNFLHRGGLNFIKGLRRQFAQHVYYAGMVDSEEGGLMLNNPCNIYHNDQELIKGVLATGLYPNIVSIRRGEVTNDKLKINNVICKDLDNNRVLLHSSSVNSDMTTFTHRLLVYFAKTKSTGTFLRDSSMVHPLAIICLAGKSISVFPVSRREARHLEDIEGIGSDRIEKVVIDNSDKMVFYMKSSAVDLLLDVVEEIDKMITACLNVQDMTELTQEQQRQHGELIALVSALVNTQQDPYIKDHKSNANEENINDSDYEEDNSVWNPKWQ